MVEGGGFEPPKAEPSDLQSDPFGRSGTPPFRKAIMIGINYFVNYFMKLFYTRMQLLHCQLIIPTLQ